MTNQLFEKAKQAVAKRYQYEDWVTAVSGRKPSGASMDRLIKELFEYGCNEAVKADRFEVMKMIIDAKWQPTAETAVECEEIMHLAANRPLPFPQQPDER